MFSVVDKDSLVLQIPYKCFDSAAFTPPPSNTTFAWLVFFSLQLILQKEILQLILQKKIVALK